MKKTYVKALFAVAINVGIFSLIGIVALLILWYSNLRPFQDYAVVIDAGSTHSTIFVYSYDYPSFIIIFIQ